MNPTKKISFLIIVLLVNFLITSCGCGKKKANPLVREEKRLKNKLKELCRPEGWKNMQETFEQDRSDSKKIDQHIQQLLALQELEKLLAPIAPKLMGGGALSPQEKQVLQPLMNLLSPFKQFPEELANKKIDDLLKDLPSLQKFSKLADPTLLPVIKDFLATQLDLWRNLKQQLESKSTEENSDSTE